MEFVAFDFARALSDLSADPVPTGWERYSIGSLQTELWHPKGWERDEASGESLLLRPPFADYVEEPGARPLASPSVTLLIASYPPFDPRAHLMERARLIGESEAWPGIVILEESYTELRGLPTLCVHFTFERAARRWEVLYVYVVDGKMGWMIDASGVPPTIDTHEDELMRVLANLRIGQ